MIFTISTGRSGTQSLNKFLKEVPDIFNANEGDPRFMNRNQNAIQKMFDQIEPPQGQIYFNTSHLFIKRVAFSVKPSKGAEVKEL